MENIILIEYASEVTQGNRGLYKEPGEIPSFKD